MAYLYLSYLFSMPHWTTKKEEKQARYEVWLSTLTHEERSYHIVCDWMLHLIPSKGAPRTVGKSRVQVWRAFQAEVADPALPLRIKESMKERARWVTSRLTSLYRECSEGRTLRGWGPEYLYDQVQKFLSKYNYKPMPTWSCPVAPRKEVSPQQAGEGKSHTPCLAGVTQGNNNENR